MRDVPHLVLVAYDARSLDLIHVLFDDRRLIAIRSMHSLFDTVI